MPPSSPPDRSDRKPPPANVKRPLWLLPVLFAAIIGITLLHKASTEHGAHPNVDYSTFYGWAQGGKVKAVTLEGAGIMGELKAPESFGPRKISAFHTLAPPT